MRSEIQTKKGVGGHPPPDNVSAIGAGDQSQLGLSRTAQLGGLREGRSSLQTPEATEEATCLSKTTSTPAARKLSALENNLLGVRLAEVPSLLPGLIVAGLVAWVGIALSQTIGVTLLGFEKTPVSPVMLAILLGLGVGNAIPLPVILKPGFRFAVKKLLRLGIILLGIRLSIFDVFRLGALGLPIVLVCIVGALLITTRVSNWLKLHERLGTLIAAGTSICGVSAIVATGPAIDAEEEEVAYAVAVITIFGLLATLLYPYAANLIFSGDPVKAGLFLGTAIHDTSQVTGSALLFADVYSLPSALDVATVAKLVRNTFMAAVIPLLALYHARRAAGGEGFAGKRKSFVGYLPLFVVGFLAVAVVRSIGDAGVRAGGTALGLWKAAAWTEIHGFIKQWAVNFLVLALAGVGLSTDISLLKGLGIKPFLVGLCAAFAVGVVSFCAISLLGSLVTF
jgi:uncharacterized integral membrane protein (TIGR00698 family)